MASHVWTVICNKTLIDPATNVVSFIDVTEKLILNAIDENLDQAFDRAAREGKKGIFFPARFQLVSWWTRSDFEKPERTEIRIAFVSPDGDRLFQQEVGIELEHNPAQRLTVNFDQLAITGMGRYWFLVEEGRSGKGVSKKWVQIAKVPLELERGLSAST